MSIKEKFIKGYLGLSISVAISVAGLGVLELAARLHETPQVSLLDWTTFKISDEANSAAYRGVDRTRSCDEDSAFSFDSLFESALPAPPPAKMGMWGASLYRPFIMHYIPNRIGGGTLSQPAALPHTVFVFGGSTVAGDGIRCNDDLLTAKLHESRPIQAFANMAVSGHNHNNSSALYLELLKSGYRPDEVWFYEGSNDATHRVAFGVPTMGYENAVMAAMNRGLAFRVIGGLTHASALARFVLHNDPRQQHLYQTEAGPPAMAATVAALTDRASLHARAVRTAGRMLEDFQFLSDVSKMKGITLRFVLQPTLFTLKNPSDEETTILAKVETNAPYIGIAHEELYAELRTRFAAAVPAGQFIDATDCLDGKDRSVFVDFVHVSPPGNALIARCLAARIGAH